MTITHTDFNLKVNAASSCIVYVCETNSDAFALHELFMTQKTLHVTGDWYYHVRTNKVHEDSRVPTFFHNRDYWVTVIEHNNGDWNSEQTYDLYIVG